MKKKVTMSRYIKIALDIAYSIINGDLKIGSKVSGRSTLASKYNVSPETIRRAIAVLRDREVVHVSENSGIIINSLENAESFVEEFKAKNNVLRIKNETDDLLIKKRELEEQITENINTIIDYSSQLKNIGLIYTMELEIPKSSGIIGKSIGECSFWQNTGATILGVKSDSGLVISPGPNYMFKADDIILFVGPDDAYKNVESFIK